MTADHARRRTIDCDIARRIERFPARLPVRGDTGSRGRVEGEIERLRIGRVYLSVCLADG